MAGTQKAVLTQPEPSPSVFPSLTKPQPYFISISLVLTPRHSLPSSSCYGFWTVFLYGIDKWRFYIDILLPKYYIILYVQRNYFVEVKMRIKLLRCAPFVCGFQSTWKHSSALIISILHLEKPSVQARCSPFQLLACHLEVVTPDCCWKLQSQLCQ